MTTPLELNGIFPVDVRGMMQTDEHRDRRQLTKSNDVDGPRQFEVAPSQRCRQISAYPLALKNGAIEAGVKPLTDAIYENGGYPQFSCEGHPELRSNLRMVSSYVCFWSPLRNQLFWEHVLAKLPEYAHVHCTREELISDSPECKLSSPFKGLPGVFYILRVRFTPNVKGGYFRRGPSALKAMLNQAHEDIATLIRSTIEGIPQEGALEMSKDSVELVVETACA